MNGLTLKLKLKQPTPETLPVAPVPAVEDEPPDWELPDFEDEICSLGVLGERVAGQVYKELHTLTEVLPSMDDHQRKYATLEFVGTSGRRLMRLAALIRWSANSWALRKCTNIAGFLQNQNVQFDMTVQQLMAAQQSLLHARVRNFDVPTAVDILHSGMYQRLPAVLETYGAAAKTTNAEILAILRSLNKTIKRRLAISEAVPPRMRRYRVADGRAHFHVEDAFTASVTLAGPESTDRWFLLSVDFRASQAEQQSYDIVGPMNEQIVDAGNRILAADDQIAADGTPPPLYKLYSFLDSLALNFRLERLFTQAVKLSRELAHKGNLRVEMARDRQSLEVFYWTDQGLRTNDKKATPILPSVYFELQKDRAPSGAAALLQSVASKGPTPPLEARLVQQWRPEGVLVSEQHAAERPLTDASFEAVFRSIVAVHIDAAIRSLYRQIVSSPHFSKDRVKPSMADGLAVNLVVKVYADLTIVVRVSPTTGRIEFASHGSDLDVNLESRVAKAGRMANENRETLVDTLLRMRASIVADSLDRKVTYLGLQCYRRPPLRPQDFARFGPGQFPFLVHLLNFPGYFFVVVIGETNFGFAVISTTLANESNQCFLGIDHIGFLQAEQLGAPSLCQDVTSDLIQKLYGYSLLRISFHMLERQLFSRHVPWSLVANSGGDKGLCVPTAKLLKAETEALLHKYAYVRVQVKGHLAPCKITVHVKFKTPPASDLPTNVTLSPTGLLSFTATHPDGSLEAFLALLSHICQTAKAKQPNVPALPSTSDIQHQ